MYRFSYAEILNETPQSIGERQRLAIEHSIGLLAAAQEKGVNSREASEALRFLRRLWVMLIEDFAKPANANPKQRRADLLFIGLWIIREAEDVSLGKSSNLIGLLEVSRTIAAGSNAPGGDGEDQDIVHR